jgi:hypothetical protein
MYYDTIILRFFDDESVKKENNYYFKEETSYREQYKKYIDFYWRIRLSTKKSHETRNTFITILELKQYFNKIFPLVTSYIKFDNPNINDNTIVYVKISGRGKNLNYNLTELGRFINSKKCTAFDVKYGIFLNELESFKRKIHKISRKIDIACHNETGYAIYCYIKNDNWGCYKKATSVLILKDIILKNSKNSYENIFIKEIVTAFYFEYINNSLTEEYIEPEYLPLLRKFKLTQILTD